MVASAAAVVISCLVYTQDSLSVGRPLGRPPPRQHNSQIDNSRLLTLLLLLLLAKVTSP